MANTPQRTRLAAILWFVAAVLAFAAVGVEFLGSQKLNWGVAAGGSFCLVMGVVALRDQGRPPVA